MTPFEKRSPRSFLVTRTNFLEEPCDRQLYDSLWMVSTVESENGGGAVWAAGSDTLSTMSARLLPWGHFRLLEVYAQTLLFASRAAKILLFDCCVEKRRSGRKIWKWVGETLMPPTLSPSLRQRRGCPTPTAFFHETAEKQNARCSQSKKQSLCIGLKVASFAEVTPDYWGASPAEAVLDYQIPFSRRDALDY